MTHRLQRLIPWRPRTRGTTALEYAILIIFIAAVISSWPNFQCTHMEWASFYTSALPTV